MINFTQDEYDHVALRVRRLMAAGRLLPAELLSPFPAPDPDVTVVIPARNEAETIASVVSESLRYAAHVLVIEGGSTDATAAIAARAGARVVRDPGIGKGVALRCAIDHVTTPISVFLDADGSHDPIDIPLLVTPIKRGLADQAHGSRALGGSDELHGGWDEFFRLTGSAFITCLINMRYGVRLSDSQNGFRAIRTDVFRALPLRSRHTTIEMELVMASLAYGFSLTEVPTHERPRAAGYSKISLARPTTWLSYGWVLIRGLCQRAHPSPIPSTRSSLSFTARSAHLAPAA